MRLADVAVSVASANALWSEVYATSGDSGSSVDVYSGVFSVLLGEHVDLTDTVLDAWTFYAAGHTTLALAFVAAALVDYAIMYERVLRLLQG